MYVLIVFGIVFIVFSLLLFFAPNLLRKLDDFGRKMLFNTEKTLAHRIITGILFLGIAWLMFYFAIVKQVTP